jgi:hypothetical protein
MEGPVLEYAAKRELPWRKWWRRVAAIFAVLLIVGGVVYFTKDDVGYWWWSRKVLKARIVCGAATFPAAAVVYDFDGTAFRPWWSDTGTPEEKAAHLLDLHDFDSLALLHERKTRSGKVRIVALRVEAMVNITGHGFFGYKMLAEARANDPKAFWAGDEFDVRLLDGTLLRPVSGRPMRIFAGQVDPVDESHFTVPYELNGVRGVLDGWLEDNPSPGAAEIVRLLDRGAVKK